MKPTRRGFLGAVAGGLLALRMNLGGGQAALKPATPRATVNLQSWDAWLKQYYTPEMVEKMAYTPGPFLTDLKKSCPLYVKPVRYTP